MVTLQDFVHRLKVEPPGFSAELTDPQPPTPPKERSLVVAI